MKSMIHEFKQNNLQKMSKNVIKLFSVLMVMIGSFAFGQTTSKDLENVGIEHNKMMDLLYRHFLDNKIQNKISLEIKYVGGNYLKNLRGYNEDDIQLGIRNLENYVQNPSFYSGNVYEGFEKVISNKSKSFLDILNTIINDESLSQEIFHQKITELEVQIDKSGLENKDLVILYSATNVARYSFDYWTKNYSQWETLDLSKNTAARKGPGRRIVGMDVAGAVGGAAGAWAVNVVPGAGQVAYGGAIIGGAVAGSVGQAVYELGSYFDLW